MNRLSVRTLRRALAILACAATLPATAVTLNPMMDETGLPLMQRLLQGSDLAYVSHLDYRGLVDNELGWAQAATFEGLTIRGASGTGTGISSGIVLSSGVANLWPEGNTSGSWGVETNTGGSNHIDRLTLGYRGGRRNGKLDSEDANVLSFRIDAPADATGLTLRFVYASEEFPEWSGSQFADGFAFMVNDVNYARLDDGTPVSLINQSSNIHFMANGENGAPGAQPIVDLEFDGFTRVLELYAPLLPGQTNEIVIAVADTGDMIYDSAVFLSSLQVLRGAVPGGVRVHDDGYIEHGLPAPVPEPSSIALLVAGMVMLGARRASGRGRGSRA